MIDREQLIDELFAQAVELSRAEQDRFFERAAGDGMSAGDGVLDEVKALLQNFQSAEDNGFLYQALVAADSVDERGQTLIDGQDFEGYKIIKLIAEGGMGEVYLAHDPELDRRVAIKLIKSHLKTKELLRRFRNERQILANLQHPNIARLFEAGANADGLPFFVMEYVEGKPIDQYASENHLSLMNRLKLFRTVCSAITCAHQNLVIHRDIKPNNILVTDKGEPKLLDFGIAKLIHESEPDGPDATATLFRVMTPEYASPEQVKGEPITTATDVYSLGVLLYELLTGRSPYKLKRRTADEMTRAICEQEPTRPSSVIKISEVSAATPPDVRKGSAFPARPSSFLRRGYASEQAVEAQPLPNIQDAASRKGIAFPHIGTAEPQRLARQLRGDLDNIVLKALRKEPQRRYASVEQFSEDIRRHLAGVPVSARKDTVAYRTSKFIQRNKISVAAAAVVMFTVLGAFVATAWEAHVARVERAKAERRFNDVRSLVNSLLFQLHDEIEKLPGSTRARELLVEQTVGYLDSVAREASGDVSFQREIATGYEKLGDVQSRLNGPNIGDTKGALASYLKALEIRKAIFAANPNDLSSGLALALAYDRVGDMLSKTNNAEGALDSRKKSLELVEKLSADDQAQTRSALAYSYVMVGRAHLSLGDLPAALDNFRKSLAIREALSSENSKDDTLRRSLISSYDGVAYVLSLNGKPGEALDYYRKSQAIVEALVSANPTNADYRRAMMDTYEWLGITFGEIGDNAKGLEYHNQALALCQAQVIADPANVQGRDDLGDVYYEIASTLMRLGRPNDALNNFRKSLENYRAVSDADPTDENARRQVYITYRQMGTTLLMAGNTNAAMDNYKKAIAVFQELAQTDPDNAETQYHLGLTYRNIGEALARIGDLKGTIENYRLALPVFEMLAARSPANAKTQTDLGLTYYDLGMAQSKLAPAAFASSDSVEDWRQARSWYQQSLDVWRDLKNHGTLRSVDASKPEELTQEIARCDSALAKK